MGKTLNPIIKYFLLLLFTAIGTFSTIFFFMPIKNAGFLIPSILGILFLIFIYISFISNRPLFDLSVVKSKKKRITIFVFTALFSFLFLFSIKGSQEYLIDNALLTKTVVYCGTFLFFYSIVLVVISVLLQMKIRVVDTQVSRLNILYYAVPSLLVWLLYFIAFYPATMTPDSLNQWEQAHNGEFNDWHPLVYTWLIMFLTQIWDSPAIVSLTQILILALIFGYIAYRFERFGVNKKLLWVIAIVFAVSPINGIFSITIWKDVLYGGFLLLFTMLIVNILLTQGKWLESYIHIVIFLLCSLGISFMRHNGYPVFILTLVMLLFFYRKQFKPLLLGLIVTIAIHSIITGPVFKALDVIPSEPNEALSIPTQQIATIIINDGYLTDEQKEYFDRIFPIELWKERFHPYNTNAIKFSREEYDRDFIFDDFTTYLKNWLQICLQNPGLAIDAFFTHTSLVWQINEPEEPGYTDTYVTNIYYGNDQGLVNTVKSPTITKVIGKYLTTTKELLSPILYRPATHLFVIALFTFVACLRNNYKALFVSVPIWLNTAAVWVAMPAQDFRYLFINTLFVYLAFIFMFLKYKRSGEDLK